MNPNDYMGLLDGIKVVDRLSGDLMPTGDGDQREWQLLRV